MKEEPYFGLILFGQDFSLVGQGSLCLNKSGQCSKSIFSYTVRGFHPIPRLRARPKCQFQNSTKILCYFLKTPEFGRSPEFWEPATALRCTSIPVCRYTSVQMCTDVQVVGCSGMQARRCGCATYEVIREELIYSSQCQASHVASHILEWKVTRNCLGTDC